MGKSQYFNANSKLILTPVVVRLLEYFRYDTFINLPNRPCHDVIQLEKVFVLWRKRALKNPFILTSHFSVQPIVSSHQISATEFSGPT